MVTIDEYNSFEKEALKSLSNRQIQGFMPVVFSHLNYQAQVFREEELIRYIDVMHEFSGALYYGSGFRYSKDEVRLIKNICDKVGKLTQKEFGRMALPWISPLAAIPMFRIVKAIAGHFKQEDISVFEVGPGSGYLGALFISDGCRYGSTDNTQAFYLWQNRLYNHLLPGEVNDMVTGQIKNKSRVIHIPWWRYCEIYKSDHIKADIVICDHALGEMDKIGLKYVIKNARQIMKGSKIPLFIFREPGLQHVSNIEEIHHECLSSDFVLVNYYGGFYAYTPKDSPLMAYKVGVQTLPCRSLFLRVLRKSLMIFGSKNRIFYKNVKGGVAFYNPSGSAERYCAREFMDTSRDHAPLDYDFIRYLGYNVP